MTDDIPADASIVIADDPALLDRVADEVFDDAVDARSCAEFFADPRHHLCVALAEGIVVGFASGVDHVHPDKPRHFWINEVGVAPAWRRRGIGRALVARLIAQAKTLGCAEAWVLTETENAAARSMYAAAGGIERDAGVMVTYRIAGTSRDAS